MKLLKKFAAGVYRALDFLTNFTLVALFAALVLILAAEIIGRALFSFSFIWSQEIAKYLFAWIVFIGSGAAFAKGGHLAVDVLLNKFPVKLKFALSLIFYLMMLLFLAVILKTGLDYSALNYSKPLYSTSATNLGVIYLGLPIGCGIMILNILRELCKMLKYRTAYFDQKGDVF